MILLREGSIRSCRITTLIFPGASHGAGQQPFDVDGSDAPALSGFVLPSFRFGTDEMGAGEDVLGFDGASGEGVLRDGPHSTDQMAQKSALSAFDSALSDDTAGQDRSTYRFHRPVEELNVYQLLVVDAVFNPQTVHLFIPNQ